MENINISEILSKEQYLECKDEVVKGLENEYSKNHTISGFLNNMFEHFTKEKSDEVFYQCIKVLSDERTIRGRRKYNTAILRSNDNTLFRNELFGSIYRGLINLHPCYDDKGEKSRLQGIHKKIAECSDERIYVPFFHFKGGFIYANLDRNYDMRYNDESKKVYLDVGQENYDILFEEILKLFSDFRKIVDYGTVSKDNEFIGILLKTKANEFKVRNGYANDGIVFRFFTNEQYDIFKELLSNNTAILQSLRSLNPFLPIEYVDGHPINVLPDKGASYNSYIAHACELYILKCVEDGKSVNIKEFLEFIKNNIISMEEIDYNHYICGFYDMYKDIAICQVENEINKTKTLKKD